MIKIILPFSSLILMFSCGIDADKIALSEKVLDDRTAIARYTTARFNKQSIDTIVFKHPTDPRVLHLDSLHQAKKHLIAYLEEPEQPSFLIQAA